jgi:ligand-binding sensor domain-containing protein/signal transduction histidine kinase
MRWIGSKQTRSATPVWLWLALLFATTGAALGERLPIKRFTTAEGLARDSINRIMQDSRGFLWFCTSEGLSRFDGYSFVNYGTEQGLPVRYVSDILESRDGLYWVATAEGLCRLKLDAAGPENGGGQSGGGGKFVTYYPASEPARRYISALYEDESGTVWCGTGNGVCRLDEVDGQWQFTFISLPWPAGKVAGNQDVQGLAGDRQGGVWVNTADGLYRRRADGAVEVYAAKEGLPMLQIRSALLCDREGRIWVATNFGLYQLSRDPRPGRRVVERVYTTGDGLTHNNIEALFQSSDGHIWVGTARGLNEFRPAAGDRGRAFVSYTLANNLSDMTVRAMAEDRDGNLWMGTESGGAMKLARNGFTSYGEEDGLGGNRIGSIFEGRGRELCVIAGHDINRFDGGRFTAVPLRLPKGITSWSWGWYQVMFQDHLGEWWMNTGQGLVRYPKADRLEQLAGSAPKAIYTRRDGLGNDDIFRLYEDARGDIWVGTLGDPAAAMSRWDRASNTFYTYSAAETGHDDSPSAFCEDPSGDLWIGFYSGGVLRYKAGQFTPFTQADGLPAGLIRGFHIDRAGRLWIAAGNGGLGRVDDPSAPRPHFTTYTMAEGLPSNQVTCVTEDAWGNLYVGTGRGVSRLDPATGHVKNYTATDGLANNFVNVSFADRDGGLWFGTLQGLSRLMPQPEPPTAPPPVLISALSVAGVAQPLPELGVTEVALPDLAANRNQIQIGFLGLSLAVGESLRYQYKLEGAGQDWSPPTDQRTVNFASLAPGAYRFLVRAVSADGTYSQSPATMTFKILPPIWRRWWFITLAVVLVGAAVFAFDRYRVARLKELDVALTESRKLTEQLTQRGAELRRANRSLSLEAAITGIISDSATLSEAAPKILRAVCELAMWDAGELWELDPQTQALRCTAKWKAAANGVAEAAPPGLDAAASPGERMSSRVRATGDLVLLADLGDGREPPQGAAGVAAAAPLSAFGFPILLGHEVLGVLKLFTRVKREQDAELVEMMSTIGSHIGQLIDRKRTEEALRKSREERLAELERVRRRIATDLHDDIGSSLTQITILSEVAHQHVERGDQNGLEPLSRIIRVSNELVDAMSDIVWAINPKKDHLSDLLQRMRRFASDIFTARGIPFRFLAPQAEKDIELGANLRREVFLVFKESVNNAVRHSGCAHAEIEFSVEADWLTLTVSDDGRGFDQALAADAGLLPRRGGNGLLSMRKRAEEMGGEYKIASAAGKGTTVTLRVPAGR